MQRPYNLHHAICSWRRQGLTSTDLGAAVANVQVGSDLGECRHLVRARALLSRWQDLLDLCHRSCARCLCAQNITVGSRRVLTMYRRG